MEFKDVTIGALGGMVTMILPLAGFAKWIARLWVKDVMREMLDERDDELMAKMKMMLRLTLSEAKASESGVSGVFASSEEKD